MSRPLVLASESAAMDGGLTAIAEVSEALASHRSRPRQPADRRCHDPAAHPAPRPRPPSACDRRRRLRRPAVRPEAPLVRAIEARGYEKAAGNRRERPIDDTRGAAVDLLIPACTSRARDTVRVGDLVTAEVPGLALALRRPGVLVRAALLLTNGARLSAEVTIPDAASTLVMKARARTVRREDRDAEDLWRCLEVAAAEGVTPSDFEASRSLSEILPILERELGRDGSALAVITRGLRVDAAARRRTRIRGLLAEVAGINVRARPAPRRPRSIPGPA